MDFSLSEDQQAIAALASQILSDRSTNERQREVEKADGPRFDRELWSQVAKAGLLGVPVPEAHGGAGLGFLEVAAILEHVGRHTAPIPILETLVLGALPLAEFGSEAQKAEWLPKVASGDAILTAALLGDALPRARSDGDDFLLSGSRLFVPAAAMADAVLVPAETDAGMSTSSRMMFADLPPSSRKTFFTVADAHSMMRRPTSVEPVNVTKSTRASLASISETA